MVGLAQGRRQAGTFQIVEASVADIHAAYKVQGR
jgi:hypothetical protein